MRTLLCSKCSGSGRLPRIYLRCGHSFPPIWIGCPDCKTGRDYTEWLLREIESSLLGETPLDSVIGQFLPPANPRPC